jgi:hypothetical protein
VQVHKLTVLSCRVAIGQNCELILVRSARGLQFRPLLIDLPGWLTASESAPLSICSSHQVLVQPIWAGSC